ncbi:MAG: hypothetical protein ACRDHZ_00750 [Ktedonobacteraceae bacterium]
MDNGLIFVCVLWLVSCIAASTILLVNQRYMHKRRAHLNEYRISGSRTEPDDEENMDTTPQEPPPDDYLLFRFALDGHAKATGVVFTGREAIALYEYWKKWTTESEVAR